MSTRHLISGDILSERPLSSSVVEDEVSVSGQEVDKGEEVMSVCRKHSSSVLVGFGTSGDLGDKGVSRGEGEGEGMCASSCWCVCGGGGGGGVRGEGKYVFEGDTRGVFKGEMNGEGVAGGEAILDMGESGAVEGGAS